MICLALTADYQSRGAFSNEPSDIQKGWQFDIKGVIHHNRFGQKSYIY